MGKHNHNFHAVTARDSTLQAMFAARKRVFVDLLRWDVPVVDDTFEVDQFDDHFATYIVLTDDNGTHRASARLLRTVGPHILGSLFPGLCDGPVPSHPEVLEITRFCIEPTLKRSERREARNELVSALAKHAIANSIAAFTAVAGQNWFRQIAAFGWRCSALGPSRRIGNEDLVALRIDIDADTLAALTATGVYNLAGYRVFDAQRETAG